jgi:hypothetical protein
MDRQKKLTSQQKTEEVQETLGQQQSAATSAREFASAEEMLRHDAMHTPVPPAIAERLEQSLAQLPRPPRSWWRRILGQ